MAPCPGPWCCAGGWGTAHQGCSPLCAGDTSTARERPTRSACGVLVAERASATSGAVARPRIFTSRGDVWRPGGLGRVVPLAMCCGAAHTRVSGWFRRASRTSCAGAAGIGGWGVPWAAARAGSSAVAACTSPPLTSHRRQIAGTTRHGTPWATVCGHLCGGVVLRRSRPMAPHHSSLVPPCNPQHHAPHTWPPLWRTTPHLGRVCHNTRRVPASSPTACRPHTPAHARADVCVCVRARARAAWGGGGGAGGRPLRELTTEVRTHLVVACLCGHVSKYCQPNLGLAACAARYMHGVATATVRCEPAIVLRGGTCHRAHARTHTHTCARAHTHTHTHTHTHRRSAAPPAGHPDIPEPAL